MLGSSRLTAISVMTHGRFRSHYALRPDSCIDGGSVCGLGEGYGGAGRVGGGFDSSLGTQNKKENYIKSKLRKEITLHENGDLSAGKQYSIYRFILFIMKKKSICIIKKKGEKLVTETVT